MYKETEYTGAGIWHTVSLTPADFALAVEGIVGLHKDMTVVWVEGPDTVLATVRWFERTKKMRSGKGESNNG